MMRITTSLAISALTANAEFIKPADNHIRFYKDPDFNGESILLAVETWKCHNDPFHPDQIWNMKDFNFNDKMSSYVAGKDVIFDLCNNNINDDCWGTNGNHGGGASANGHVGWNDKMTTFKATCADPKRMPAMVFNDDNCRGDSIRVDFDAVDGKSVYWNRNDIEHGGLKNDRANSVMVPENYSLFVYEDDGQRGNYQQIDGQRLNYNGVMPCVNLNPKDKMTSLAYHKTKIAGQPMHGHWQAVGINHGVNTSTFKFTTEATNEHGETVTEENKESISESWKAGWEFVADFTAEITASYTHTLSQAVEDVTTYGHKDEVDIPCALGNWAVGLYQWVGNTADMKNTVKTNLRQCRYDELADTAPACPPSACMWSKDAYQCEVCHPDWKATSLSVPTPTADMGFLM